MKVVVVAGGRFHAFQLAQQLIKRHALEKFITFSYRKTDSALIPSSHVHTVSTGTLLDTVIERLSLQKLIPASRLHVLKDGTFDRRLQNIISGLEHFDFFIGWAHYFLQSIPIIKSRKAVIVLESGSCHISTQEKLLQEEYARYKIPYPPIHRANKEKTIAEYEQADYIMTLSSFARTSFINQGIATRKLLTVPCGVNTSAFQHIKKQEDVEGKARKFIVLFVGLLQLRKGVHYLLDDVWHLLNLPELTSESHA